MSILFSTVKPIMRRICRADLGTDVYKRQGQIVAMIFAIIIIFTKSHDVHITFQNFKIAWKIIKDIYVVGVPSIVMLSLIHIYRGNGDVESGVSA